MTVHAPKVRALEALVEGQLSARGQRRLERHLARCETCRAALTSAREYAALRDAARELPMPELSWERFERALAADSARHAPPTGHNGKILALALPVLTVAATVLIGWIGISGQREVAEVAAHRSAAHAPAVRVADAAIAGWVTVGPPDTQPPGAKVTEGATLRTREGEELHVRLSANTGIVLWADSELSVSRLRQHEVRLSLLRGSVSSVVQKLAAGDSYVVEAGDLAAEVRGTHFFVGRTGDGVEVDVHEGSVAILQQGKQIDLLRAGQSYAPTGARGAARVERSVIGLDAGSAGWPTLTLPALPQVRAWLFGDARWDARDGIAMRAPAGEVALSFEDHHGKLHGLKVPLAATGGRVDERMVRAALPAPAATSMGVLLPDQISPVIEAALPGLRRCYEQGLLLSPSLKGLLTLAVRVAADGQVARTAVSGNARIPTQLSRCIGQQASNWRFPAPSGGPVSFEIALNLKAGAAP